MFKCCKKENLKHVQRCWAVVLDSAWPGLDETRESKQLIQCELVITKTNSKPRRQWSPGLPMPVISGHLRHSLEETRRLTKILSIKPCNQVIAIKSLSLGCFHCATASSILRSFRCLVGCFCGCTNVAVAPLQALLSRFHGSPGHMRVFSRRRISLTHHECFESLSLRAQPHFVDFE